MRSFIIVSIIVALWAHNGRPATRAAEILGTSMQATVHNSFTQTQADIIGQGLAVITNLIDDNATLLKKSPVVTPSKPCMLLLSDQDPENYYRDGSYHAH